MKASSESGLWATTIRICTEYPTPRTRRTKNQVGPGEHEEHEEHEGQGLRNRKQSEDPGPRFSVIIGYAADNSLLPAGFRGTRRGAGFAASARTRRHRRHEDGGVDRADSEGVADGGNHRAAADRVAAAAQLPDPGLRTGAQDRCVEGCGPVQWTCAEQPADAQRGDRVPDAADVS